jgi:hypothetical protein
MGIHFVMQLRPDFFFLRRIWVRMEEYRVKTGIHMKISFTISAKVDTQSSEVNIQIWFFALVTVTVLMVWK